MQHFKANVATICIGMAASAAAILLSSGAKGKRFSLPNSRIMIHQPMGGAQGQFKDLEITVREIERLKKVIDGLLAKHTGQPIKKIETDTDRDFWMSPDDAKKYGIIDKIIQ